MKIIKKIIPLVFVFSLLISSVSYAKNMDDSIGDGGKKVFHIMQSLSNDFKFIDVNEKAYEKRFFKVSNSISSASKIELNLVNEEDIILDEYVKFIGDGHITIDGENIPYTATGMLYTSVDNKNEIVFLGTLVGYINNSNEEKDMVSLSVQYMPDLNKAFISACIGIDDGKGSVPLMLDFGTPFNEITEAYLKKDKHIKEKESQQNLTEQQDNMPISIMSYGGTVTDYDPRLKNTGYSTNNIMTVSVYYQNKARFQTNNEVSAKVSANKANFENFMRSTYGYNIVTNSTDASTVKLEIVSADINYESTASVVPTANTTNLNFTLPVYIGLYNLGWQTIPINITTSSTNVSYRPALGADSSKRNITTWQFYRFAGFASTNFFTSSTTPEVDGCGLAGRSIYTYLMGVPSDKTITVGAMGSTVLTCVENSTTYITRSYNISATAASSMIICIN